MRRWHIPDVRGWLIWLFRLKTCPYCFSWSTDVCDRDRYRDGLDCTRAQFVRQPRRVGTASVIAALLLVLSAVLVGADRYGWSAACWGIAITALGGYGLLKLTEWDISR